MGKIYALLQEALEYIFKMESQIENLREEIKHRDVLIQSLRSRVTRLEGKTE